MYWLRFFRRRKWDTERASELSGYLEQEIADNIARGMSAEEARDAAHRKLGNLTAIREDIYRMNSIAFIETLQRDLRHSCRVLWKSPGFTLAVVTVLALGIGANSAVFSIVNAVMLRPLPFKDSSQLVRLFHTPPQKTFPGVTRFSVSPANYLAWKRENRVFANMAAYGVGRLALTGEDHAEVLTVGVVEPDFFAVVGALPAQGRIFSQEEAEPGQNKVAIVSDSFWKTHLASASDVLGKTLRLNREVYRIVGVMPPSFELKSWGATGAALWTPMAWDAKEREVRGIHNYNVIARLKPGVSLTAALAEMDVISVRLAQQYPVENEGWGSTGVLLQELVAGNLGPSLLILLGAVAFVLLIAAANVANLVLARTLGRAKEIAVRVSLGASRIQILQQVLVETVVLSVAGGTVGLLLARATIRLASTSLSDLLPPGTLIEIDGKVLAFTLGVAVFTGMIAGLFPALRAGKTELNDALKRGGREVSASTDGRTRGLLVVSEVALSFILLVGAGLMLRSLWALHRVDPGFDPHNILTMAVSIPRTQYATPVQRSAFFQAVLDRARALPGVEAAGVIDNLPVVGGGSIQPFSIEGRPIVPQSEEPTVAVRDVSPGSLGAMRIPLLAGRDLRDDDKAAVLVTQTMAKAFWPGENPLGRHLKFDFSPGVSWEVVGIVGDVRQQGLSQEPGPTVYQWANPRPDSSLFILVRTTSDPKALSRAMTNLIHEIDREQPVQNTQTMEEVVESTLTTDRFNTFLLTIFAGLAALLAGVGIYSVLAYGVRRRTREIGIRTALGAKIGDIVGTVLLEGMKPAIAGILIGLAGSLSLSRVASQLTYGVKPTDPPTLIATAVFFGLVALAAGALPAYRAGRVDPVRALREE